MASGWLTSTRVGQGAVAVMRFRRERSQAFVIKGMAARCLSPS